MQHKKREYKEIKINQTAMTKILINTTTIKTTKNTTTTIKTKTTEKEYHQ